MLLILLLLGTSFLVYQVSELNRPSVVVRPTLANLVFYRDYLALTMIPYAYYIWGDRYKEHYILGQLDGDKYFIYAAISAFVFIIVFYFTYRILFPVFRGLVSQVRIGCSFQRLRFSLRLGASIFFVVAISVSYHFGASVFSFIQGQDYVSAALLRHQLSHGGGVLAFNKIFMKSWVPMLSYLFVYAYFAKLYEFRFIDKLAMMLSFIAGLFAALFFLEKSVLFFYLFGFVGIYVYSGGVLRLRTMLILFLLALTIVSILYLLTYGEKVTGASYLRDIIVHRTMTQSAGSVMAFDYFSKFDFKGLSGISRVLANMVGESFSSPYSDIIKYYVPENADTSGAMSSFVTGEAYGLFGVVGVIISGAVIAVWYSFLEATKYSKAMAVIFVGAYGVYFSHPFVASSFFGFVWPVGFLYSLIPFVVLILFCAKYRRN